MFFCPLRLYPTHLPCALLSNFNASSYQRSAVLMAATFLSVLQILRSLPFSHVIFICSIVFLLVVLIVWLRQITKMSDLVCLVC